MKKNLYSVQNLWKNLDDKGRWGRRQNNLTNYIPHFLVPESTTKKNLFKWNIYWLLQSACECAYATLRVLLPTCHSNFSIWRWGILTGKCRTIFIWYQWKCKGKSAFFRVIYWVQTYFLLRWDRLWPSWIQFLCMTYATGPDRLTNSLPQCSCQWWCTIKDKFK